jgi:hypothetical protein
MKNNLIISKKAIVLSCFFTLIILQKSFSQVLSFGETIKVEVGLNFGPTFFLGDLGGKVGKGTTFIKDLNYEFTKLMKGGFVNFYPTEWIGLRVAGQYTYLAGDDNVISTHGVDELWRKQRNLDFKSDVWEVYAAIEFYPLDYINRNDEDYYGRFKPYFFGGVGMFNFNPKGSLKDGNGNITWHDLQPLKTEGQGFPEYPNSKPYKLTQMNLPMGFGAKYFFSDKVNIGLEFLYRKTFTDYIDDISTTYIDPAYFTTNLSAADALIANRISDKTIGIVTPGVGRYAPGVQRGNPSQNDAYFSLLARVGIRLGNNGAYGNGSNGSYAGGASSRNQSRCPSRF